MARKREERDKIGLRAAAVLTEAVVGGHATVTASRVAGASLDTVVAGALAEAGLLDLAPRVAAVGVA